VKSADNNRVAVIGGGISGLAAAHRLVEIDPTIDVSLFEASGRLGGVLETTRRDGFLIEHSADNFITDVPWATDLCQRVGLGDRLLATNEADRRALVVCRGRLEPIPEGFAIVAPRRLTTMLTTPILSVAGKLRLAAEYFIPRGTDHDESLASFARRRFGRETYQRLIQPLVGGIYTADPEKLSLKATLPRFAEMEQRHRSLIRAAWRDQRAAAAGPSASGVRYTLFTAPQDGLASLVGAIEARLPHGAVNLRQRIEKASRAPSGRWHLTTTEGAEFAPFDAVIVATPGPPAARLVSTFDDELSTQIGSIEYAGCVVVALAYARSQIARPLDGFGFVVPLIERRQILSASFSSVKYAGRAPQDQVLIRAFIGGACQRELLDKDDDELARIAARELADLLTIAGEPHLVQASRWERAMPQYHVGHLGRVAKIENLIERHAGLALAGNAYRGVGIPQCIRSGEEAAQRIITGLRGQGL
jgi:oxygen-dependent protoporphyrinogen oxidase